MILNIKAELTNYWNIAKSCSNVLSIYIPSTWDNLSILEDNTTASFFTTYYYILIDGSFDTNTHTWLIPPHLNERLIPVDSLVTHTDAPHDKINFKFYDDNNTIKLPIQQNIDSNTQNYFQYIPSDEEMALDDYYYAYKLNYAHDGVNDNLNLYQEVVQYDSNIYYAKIEDFTTNNDIIENFIYVGTNMQFINNNPKITFMNWLARCSQYNNSAYYLAYDEHNRIWQDLYHNYPGIFRESHYVNNSASDCQELYEAAKSELEKISRPAFEYSLTGMDIYAYDFNYLPTQIKLGDQIRIDHQQEDELNDTLNTALKEPLYITGIDHSLRNDGDYKFVVATHTASNTMIQRFAQLLAFGR